MKLEFRRVIYEFPARPLIMGIVNLSGDSFSGDGLADVDAALIQARSLINDGADIIDVGAESARTNRAPISEQEEIDRFGPFVSRWHEVLDQRSPGTAYPTLSINTWRPAVVRAVLREGGDLLNDIGGLPADENARACAETGAALLIMHTVGAPKVPHTHVGYDDVMQRLHDFFTEKIALAERTGLSRDAIVLDPGIDFAKQREDNLRIYRDLTHLHRLGRPILLPTSRKTVIGDVLGLPAPERDPGTIACLAAGQIRGAHIFRVHNVRAAAQAARMIEAIVVND